MKFGGVSTRVSVQFGCLFPVLGCYYPPPIFSIKRIPTYDFASHLRNTSKHGWERMHEKMGCHHFLWAQFRWKNEARTGHRSLLRSYNYKVRLFCPHLCLKIKVGSFVIWNRCLFFMDKVKSTACRFCFLVHCNDIIHTEKNVELPFYVLLLLTVGEKNNARTSFYIYKIFHWSKLLQELAYFIKNLSIQSPREKGIRYIKKNRFELHGRIVSQFF